MLGARAQRNEPALGPGANTSEARALAPRAFGGKSLRPGRLSNRAQTRLEAEGIPAEVISMPCWELFDRQDAGYRRELLRPDTVKVALEAAAPFGWERYVGLEGAAIGITRFGASRFGASAPYEVLYEKFGITAEAVVKAVKERL